MKKLTPTAYFFVLIGLLLTDVQRGVAIDKIYSPLVEQGELELETKGTYAIDDDNQRDDDYLQYFGLGYGFTDRLFAEIYGGIAQAPQESTDFYAVLLEMRYQLTDHKEYWLDTGAYLEYKFETEDEEHELEAKLLLEKAVTTWIHTANLGIERKLFSGTGEDWEGAVRWSSRYQFSPSLEPGIELHSELGELNEWTGLNDKQHSAGPALYGTLADDIGYEFATLIGISDEAADVTLRWVVEFEFD